MTPQLSVEVLRRFPKNGPTDPIAFYSEPVTGWLYRERINLGLRLLPPRRYERGLEIGYGSGAVLAAIASAVDECHGVDLDADPAIAINVLEAVGVKASLRKGDVCALPYGDATFDLVWSFSVFEHLADYPRALSEVHRVLKPGGHFLLGMPAVNRVMEAGFRAIGFKNINDHHITAPHQVAGLFDSTGFARVRDARLTLPFPGGPGFPVYFDWLLQKR